MNETDEAKLAAVSRYVSMSIDRLSRTRDFQAIF